MKKKSGSQRKSATAKKRNPRMAAALAKLANVIVSPVETVNSVMQWLNSHFGLNLAVIPLPSWLSSLTSLWEMPIIGGIPSHPPPWDIEIDGNWPGIFPQTGTPPLMMENIVIHVRQGQPGTPQ